MGKRKIDIVDMITDKMTRNVTYCKRKKGLLKKAMELSILCGQDIQLIMWDRMKKKMVAYQSTPDFTH